MSDSCGVILAMPTDARESIAVGEIVLPMTLPRPYKLSGPIYLHRLYSVTLTACTDVPQSALHKMVDT